MKSLKTLKSISLCSLLFLGPIAHGAVRSSSCSPALADEAVVVQGDFHWGMTLEEIVEKEAEIRASGKRLQGRAYINEEGKVVMPLKNWSGGPSKEVPLSEGFISSISKQVEKAFERGYVNALIFPDMGHSHLIIPKDFYERELSGLGASNFDILYQKVFDNPETKILYHTAEQLKLLGEDKLPLVDRVLQWRFYTRNIVGYLDNLGTIDLVHEQSSIANTARDYRPDIYRYWGAGFNISTSKDGCFSYKVGDQTFFYDLSFEDLPL